MLLPACARQDYDERVIPSIANEASDGMRRGRQASQVMKATIAQYNAESLLTQREQAEVFSGMYFKYI